MFAPYFQRIQQLFSDAETGFLTLHLHVTAKKILMSEKPVGDENNGDENNQFHDLLEIENRLKVKNAIASLHLHVGRPEIQPYLDTLIVQCDSDTGVSSIAVSACGPLGLCDGAREAVKARLGKVSDKVNLEYHEETFTW